MSENKNNKTYFALRFRSNDSLHHKGDVRNVTEDVLRIGQTDECEVQIMPHPNYADTCYAIIAKDEDNNGWNLVRQEPDAEISVNGTPLSLVAKLHNGDLLKLDHTIMQFTVQQGEAPTVSYIRNKTPWSIWAAICALFLFLACIVGFLHHKGQKNSALFKNEISSIYQIEADTLLVLSSQGDTLDVLRADHPSVGTGFITEDGYLVTARHCVEFWLAMENELKPNLNDIESDIVRRAIDAELNTDIHLVAKLKITSNDGKQSWLLTSDDFTMDKSRDDVNECGDFDAPYLWRSVVSQFEKKDAELGDVAVMKWPHGTGTIKLESPDALQQPESKLYSFGYPQDGSRQRAHFATNDGNLYHAPSDPDSCFICEKGFDPGFSGGPVFSDSHKVVGIVSRSDEKHTLIVPVSQIHRLIKHL